MTGLFSRTVVAVAVVVGLLALPISAQTELTGQTSGGAYYRISVPDGWTPADGLVVSSDGAREALLRHTLSNRSFSPASNMANGNVGCIAVECNAIGSVGDDLAHLFRCLADVICGRQRGQHFPRDCIDELVAIHGATPWRTLSRSLIFSTRRA